MLFGPSKFSPIFSICFSTASALLRIRSLGFKGGWLALLLCILRILTLYSSILTIASYHSSDSISKVLVCALSFYGGSCLLMLILVWPTSKCIRSSEPYVSMKDVWHMEVFTLIVRDHRILGSSFTHVPFASLVFLRKVWIICLLTVLPIHWTWGLVNEVLWREILNLL